MEMNKMTLQIPTITPSMENPISLKEILPSESCRDFMTYYGIPAWMTPYFQPAFDHYRAKVSAKIYLALNSAAAICGCIFYDPTPEHRSYGKQVPTFGWLKADSPAIAAQLLTHIERDAKEHGAAKLRGPINSPKSFGGWGAVLKDADHPLFECAHGMPDQAKWLQTAGYTLDAEYINLYNTNLLDVPAFPNIELTSPPITEILGNPQLLQQIGAMVGGAFANFLPDVSPPTRVLELLSLMTTLPHPEDFYFLAWDRTTHDLVAYIFEIPNFFEHWQGRNVTMGNTDSVVIKEGYRGAAFFHYLYNQLTAKLHARGVIHREGTMIWTKNTPAIQSFSKIGYECRRFGVYQKILQ
jgi:hypothetical protein